MSILITWAALTVAMWAAAKLLPSMEIRGGIASHFLVSAGFGLLLFLTGWIFHLLLGVVSFGLLFVLGFVARVLVGAIVLKLVDTFTNRLRVDGFGTAILAAVIISVIGTVTEALMRSV